MVCRMIRWLSLSHRLPGGPVVGRRLREPGVVLFESAAPTPTACTRTCVVEALLEHAHANTHTQNKQRYSSTSNFVYDIFFTRSNEVNVMGIRQEIHVMKITDVAKISERDSTSSSVGFSTYQNKPQVRAIYIPMATTGLVRTHACALNPGGWGSTDKSALSAQHGQSSLVAYFRGQLVRSA